MKSDRLAPGTRQPTTYRVLVSIWSLVSLFTAGVLAARSPGQGETETAEVAHVYGVRGLVTDGHPVVEWRMGPAAGSVSFRLERMAGSGSSPVHQGWIAPLSLAPVGHTFRVADAHARLGSDASYLLVERNLFHQVRVHGPFVVESGGGAGAVAKAFVRETGLHRITSVELATALGQTVSKVETFIDRELIAISNQGLDVGWLPGNGNTELLFFATGVDSRYTEDNVYWVHFGAAATLLPAASVGTEVAAPGGVFTSESRSESDLVAALSITKFEDVDFWYWDGVRAENPDLSRLAFPLAAPDAAAGQGTAELTVRLAGATRGSGYNYHQALIYLNGSYLGDIEFLGLYTIEGTLTFDSSLLLEDNLVEVEAVMDESALGSAFFIDWFELDYPRDYRADSDQLLLRPDGNSIVTVDGFGRDDIVV